MDINQYVGQYVSLVNDKMSLIGYLRSVEKGKYRLDIRNQEGFYIFKEEEVLNISVDNSILIILK